MCGIFSEVRMWISYYTGIVGSLNYHHSYDWGDRKNMIGYNVVLYYGDVWYVEGRNGFFEDIIHWRTDISGEVGSQD